MRTDVSEYRSVFICSVRSARMFGPGDEGTDIFRNVRNSSPTHTASQHDRFQSSSTPLWEPVWLLDVIEYLVVRHSLGRFLEDDEHQLSHRQWNVSPDVVVGDAPVLVQKAVHCVAWNQKVPSCSVLRFAATFGNRMQVSSWTRSRHVTELTLRLPD